MPAAPTIESSAVDVDPTMQQAIIDSVTNALVMCDIKARCVAVAAVPTQDSGLLTGMIGVHGRVSGFITVNMSERLAIHALEGLLQEKFDSLNSQVIDGVGEMTNIIVGGIKSSLANSNWTFSHITVPSVIVGHGYNINYSRGLEFVSVTFEHLDEEAIMLEDRLMHISISLLRL